MSYTGERFKKSGVAGNVGSDRSWPSSSGSTGRSSSGSTPSSGSSGNHSTPGFCATCFKENPSEGWGLDADGRCRKHGGVIGQTLGLTPAKKVLLGLGGALGAFLVGAAVVSSKGPKQGS